ncbi:MAG: redoxin domain-containing protein [Anaerolineales bacterium]|nr:redoxin domain-containing protein [Anaerolineales bacterium]MCB8953048.1 redoxin domain-containing protein [Ardenticatenales bacterium]
MIFNPITLLLGLLAMIIVRANRAWYRRKIKNIQVPRKPITHQLLAALGVAVAIFTFTRPLDVIGFLLAAVALLAGIRFIYTSLSSHIPPKSFAVRIGEPVPDFTALDGDGNAFTLSSLRGRPVLVKFFRGHW